MAKPFKIASWNPETESWKPLASFASYDAADEALDRYCDKYPHAWIEILDPTC